MSIDYSVAYLAVTGATGLIVLVDSLRRRGRRPPSASGLVDAARSIFPVVLVVLLVRSFLVEPFRIPSASMMPGLEDGDFILVSKFTYGVRLPVLNTEFLSVGKPQRGDVVVFRLPSDPSVHFIKRLVGLPGDHIVVRADRLFINGSLITLRAAGDFRGGFGFNGARVAIERFGAADHEVMFARGRYATDYEGTVPAGHYFFMGDNRDDSEDSRFPLVGFVPERNLVGPAFRILLNWHGGRFDGQRAGKKIL